MNAAQRRILAAQIPPRLRGLSLEPNEERYLPAHPDSRSDAYLETWRSHLSDGSVIRAVGDYRHCGKGLWATGGPATAYVTALMRDAILQSESVTGLYLGIDDYLDSIRPDGDRRFADKVTEIDLLVLANVGTEFSSDWSRASVRSLLLKRFDLGLPTLVSSNVTPDTYLSQSLAREMFVRIAIMETT